MHQIAQNVNVFFNHNTFFEEKSKSNILLWQCCVSEPQKAMC